MALFGITTIYRDNPGRLSRFDGCDVQIRRWRPGMPMFSSCLMSAIDVLTQAHRVARILVQRLTRNASPTKKRVISTGQAGRLRGPGGCDSLVFAKTTGAIRGLDRDHAAQVSARWTALCKRYHRCRVGGDRAAYAAVGALRATARNDAARGGERHSCPSCCSWRALLTARRMVLNKRRDVQNGVRALLRVAGLKVGTPSRKDFPALRA